MPEFTAEIRSYKDDHAERPWVVETHILGEPEVMTFRFESEEERGWALARLQEATH